MKKTSGFLMLFIWISVGLAAQEYENWYTYGDVGDDVANSIVQTSDGRYLIIGYTRDATNKSTARILFYDPLANNPWGFFAFEDEVSTRAFDAIELTDGSGYLLVGSIGSGLDAQMWAVKCDDSGAILWEKTYGDGTLQSVFESDAGFVVGGTKLMILDVEGSVITQFPVNCVDVIPSSNAIIALGNIEFYNTMKLTKLILDVENNFTIEIEWETTFDNYSSIYPSNVEQTADNDGFIIAASGSDYSGEYLKGLLFKTDEEGNLEWSAEYPGVFFQQIEEVKPTPEGGFIVAGLTEYEDIAGEPYNEMVWVMKTDKFGSEQWSFTNQCDTRNYPTSVCLLPDGGYVFAGVTRIVGDMVSCGETTLTNTNIGLFFLPPYGLTAWFTASPRIVSTGEAVHFWDGSLGQVESWAWDFNNDGLTDSNQEDPVYYYDNENTYTIKLTINNLASEFTRTDYIIVDNNYIPPPCGSNGDASDQWIESIAVGSFSNISGSSVTSGYQDFTLGTPIDLTDGSSYSIELNPGSSPGKPVLKWWKIWLDLNQDGDFDDENEELFASEGSKTTVTGNIQIPTPISFGETRLRITMSTDGELGPCDEDFIGEVEDYTVFLSPYLSQPPLADFEASSNNVGIDELVYFTDLSGNGPTSWSWSFDPNTVSFSEETNSGSQNPVVKFNSPGEYTVTLTVTNDIGSNTEVKTNFIIVSSSPPQYDYCPPQNVYTSLIYYIKEITIGDVSNTSGNNSGYKYFFNGPSFSFLPGENYAILLVPVGDRDRNFWRIWLDLDGDGLFNEENGETLFVANNKKGPVYGEISIPSDASALGTTRLRISMKKESAQTGPCDDDFYGEVEDYNVEFLSESTKSAPVTKNNPDQAIQLRPNPVSGTQLDIILVGYDQPMDIQIYNNQGITVDRIGQATQNLELNTAGYTPGIYFIRFRTGTGTLIKKFVKL